MIKRSHLAIGMIILALTVVGLACSFGTPTGTTTPAAPTTSSGDIEAAGTLQFSTPIPTYIQEESANAIQAATYALAIVH